MDSTPGMARAARKASRCAQANGCWTGRCRQGMTYHQDIADRRRLWTFPGALRAVAMHRIRCFSTNARPGLLRQVVDAEHLCVWYAACLLEERETPREVDHEQD